MKFGDYLTLALVAQYVVLAVAYGCGRDWVKALYWLGATLLTAAVLKMK